MPSGDTNTAYPYEPVSLKHYLDFCPPGYRHVRLLKADGSSLSPASLFIHVTIAPKDDSTLELQQWCSWILEWVTFDWVDVIIASYYAVLCLFFNDHSGKSARDKHSKLGGMFAAEDGGHTGFFPPLACRLGFTTLQTVYMHQKAP